MRDHTEPAAGLSEPIELESTTRRRPAVTPTSCQDQPVNLIATRSEIDRQIGEVGMQALSAYVRALWPTAAALFVSSEENPTFVVDAADQLLAGPGDLDRRNPAGTSDISDDLWELVSKLPRGQRGRYCDARGARITFPPHPEAA